MQDRQNPDLATQKLRVKSKFQKTHACRLHQGFEQKLLVRPDDPVQFLGNRENQMEIPAWKQVFEPGINPLLPRLALAGRAGAVPARVIPEMFEAAIFATIEVPAQRFSMALANVAKRLFMRGKETLFELFLISRAEFPDDVRQTLHGYTASAICSMAFRADPITFSVMWVYMAVVPRSACPRMI